MRKRKVEQGAKKTICRRFLPRSRYGIGDIRSRKRRAILRESRKMNLSWTLLAAMDVIAEELDRVVTSHDRSFSRGKFRHLEQESRISLRLL